ncbi:hypothetical protein [Sphingomonas zeae]|jgi:hypothetical protein
MLIKRLIIQARAAVEANASKFMKIVRKIKKRDAMTNEFASSISKIAPPTDVMSSQDIDALDAAASSEKEWDCRRIEKRSLMTKA